MRLAVTGRNGQVAMSLVERAAGRPDVTVIAVGRPDLDLAAPDTVAPALAAAAPDVIVSAAAYTAVDRAEDEPDRAFAVNEEGARHVAAAAARLGVPVIHLSTDYVFDGEANRPYREDDAVAPRGVYGASKLAGERAVAAANPRHLILRTAWVYSPFGGNFVKTMLRLAGERDALSVVADQHGNPTSALDIADGVLAAAAAMVAADGRPAPCGLYHLAGSGTASWADFARFVLAASAALGGPTAPVRDIATSEFPTRAVRPANSRLDTARFAADFGWTAPPWQRSAEAVVRRLLAAGEEGRTA